MGNKVNIMLIGPLPPPIGGTLVSFEILCKELAEINDVNTVIINTSKNSLDTKLGTISFTTFKVLSNLVNNIKKCDIVSFHASNRGIIFFGPIVFLFAKLFRKPIIIRIFGGAFDKHFLRQNSIFRYILQKTVLSADICLLQTKKLVDYFIRYTNKQNYLWFPTSRPMVNNMNIDRKDVSINKYVFISHIKKTKGIFEIIHAANSFENDTIDIYGPLFDAISEDDINKKNIRYLGIIAPSRVTNVLRQYDVLLFPTFYDGEGYPGIILEAFSEGVPVITTRWNSIPELVDSSCGILIEPKNTKQLIEAMESIKDVSYYKKLQKGIYKRRKYYDSKYWANEFYVMCKKLKE